MTDRTDSPEMGGLLGLDLDDLVRLRLVQTTLQDIRGRSVSLTEALQHCITEMYHAAMDEACRQRESRSTGGGATSPVDG